MTIEFCWIYVSLAICSIFFLILWLLQVKAPTKFTPKNIVIIGGSSGLGLELAKIYSKKYPNANLILLSRKIAKLQEAKNQLSTPKNCQIISLDICQNIQNNRSHEKIVEELKEKIKVTPDILVCSAGAAHSGAFEKTSVGKFQQQMDLHYFSCVLPTHAFIEDMKKQGHGRICFVSSVGGQLGVWGFSAYSSSKFAIVGLAQCLFHELRPYNISVTICYPPDMDTPGFQEEMKTKPWECQKISETGGLLQAKDVAKTLFTDIENGNFYSVHGMDAWLSTVGSVGWSPNTGVFRLFYQLFLQGLVRFIFSCYLRYFDYISKRGKEMREAGTYQKKNS